jgi:uncharacterized protein YdhG (YjbR/CyaY superfamily)
VAKVAGIKNTGIVLGGVDEYVDRFPQNIRALLIELRSQVLSAAPEAKETTSYFDMPGYFYEGYDYNGMFAWFSYKSPNLRLHVRPPVLDNHKEDVRGFMSTKAIINFPASGEIPKELVRKLVKASIIEMKRKVLEVKS